MQLEGIIAKGQLVGLHFMQDAVAASQTDAQLPVIESGATSGTTGVDGYTMPFDGSIVGVSYVLSAAATAGTLSIGATVNGTEKTDPTLSVTTGTSGSDKATREASRFVAGDKIGAEITTSADWDGINSDLGVVVWALLNIEGI